RLAGGRNPSGLAAARLANCVAARNSVSTAVLWPFISPSPRPGGGVSRKKAEFGRASCHQLKKPKMAGNPSSEAHLSDPRTHHVTALLIHWRGGAAGACDK